MKKMLMALCVLLHICLLTAFAVETIAPDERGVYTVTASSLEPNADYVLLVLGGAEEPVTISEDNVFYYDIVTTDADGNLSCSFLPTFYDDATVYVSNMTSVSPTVLCTLHADNVRLLDRIDITLDADSVSFTKADDSFTLHFTVTAYDSFGNETELPENVACDIRSYLYSDIVVDYDAKTVTVAGSVAEGTYTLYVEAEGVAGEAAFTVSHDRTPTEMRYSVQYEGGETEYASYYVYAISDINGVVYEPTSLPVTLKTFDVFGNEIVGANYTFTCKEYDDNNIAGEEKTLSRGTSLDFTPPAFPGIDQKVKYDIIMTSDDNPALSKTLRVIVIGQSTYTGTTLSLYQRYLEAETYVEKMENGAIVTATSGKEVSSDVQWTTSIYADYLVNYTSKAEDILRRALTEQVKSSEVSNTLTKLRNTLVSFKQSLRYGEYAPITTIVFESKKCRLAVKKSEVFAATVVPSKPSERVIYTSSNTAIATVKSLTGEVTATGTPGTVTITASNEAGTVFDSYELTVYVPVSSVALEYSVVYMFAGETRRLSETVLPLAADSRSVTWSSSERGIAAVTDGLVTAYAPGEVDITVTTLEGNYTATCHVVIMQKLGDNEVLGDIDGDGDVTALDAELLFKYTMYPDDYPVTYAYSMDFNADGTVDLQDAVRLKQYAENPASADLFPDKA